MHVLKWAHSCLKHNWRSVSEESGEIEDQEANQECLTNHCHKQADKLDSKFLTQSQKPK